MNTQIVVRSSVSTVKASRININGAVLLNWISSTADGKSVKSTKRNLNTRVIFKLEYRRSNREYSYG